MAILQYKKTFWEIILLTNLVLLLNFLLHITFTYFNFNHYEILEAVIIDVLLIGIVHSVLYFLTEHKK